jgi:hypothetical protein
MKKEILKGFTMLTLILAIALATAVVSANAQSIGTVTNIPFEFVVGDKAMPAGKYKTNAANSAGNVLLIQSDDRKNAVVRLTHTIQPTRSRGANACLVFHRYGDRYFLAEVWNGGDSTGRQLSKSRQERAIAGELARLSTKGESGQGAYETVVIAAAFR